MEELTVYNANYLKVRLKDNTITYIEEQEHCDIWWRTPEDGVGGYYGLYRDDNNDTIIYFRNGSGEVDFSGKIVAYSHDYGKTWTEVK